MDFGNPITINCKNAVDNEKEFLLFEGSSPRAVDVTEDTCLSFSNRPAIGTKRDHETALRVVSYNIHGWRDTFHVDNLERIIAMLSAVKADVITLQEVLHPYFPPTAPDARAAYFERVKSGKGNGFQNVAADEENRHPYLNILATALGMTHISFGQATSDGYFGAFGYGNAILSKFPIVCEEHVVIKADEKHQAGRRIEAEDRCFSAVTLELSPTFRYTVCVTHLDQLSDPLRLEQVESMLRRTAELGPHLFCGDFNVFQRADCSPPQWAAILADAAGKGWPAPPETTDALQALLAAGYRDCYYLSRNHRRAVAGAACSNNTQAESDWMAVESGCDECEAAAEEDSDTAAAAADDDNEEDGVPGVRLSDDGEFPGATCWVTKPLLRIDYAFLSPVAGPGRGGGCVTAEVRRYQRVMDEASDHFPIMLDVVLRRGRGAAAGRCGMEGDSVGPEVDVN